MGETHLEMAILDDDIHCTCTFLKLFNDQVSVWLFHFVTGSFQPILCLMYMHYSPTVIIFFLCELLLCFYKTSVFVCSKVYKFGLIVMPNQIAVVQYVVTEDSALLCIFIVHAHVHYMYFTVSFLLFSCS